MHIRTIACGALAAAILLAGCPRGAQNPGGTGTPKPKATAKDDAKAAASRRVLNFQASTKDGKPAPQPKVIQIKINGEALELEREPPTVPEDAKGTVEIETKGGKRTVLSLPENAPKAELKVVVLPWKDKIFIGELLGSDVASFAARLKKRAVTFTTALPAMTDANVKGVYVGRFRVPRHVFVVEGGNLLLDPSAEYYVRLSESKHTDKNPPIRVLFEEGGSLKAFKFTLKEWPKVLPPKGTAPPSEGAAPAIQDKPTTVAADQIAAKDAVTATTLAAFESDEVKVDDEPFPDPGE